MKRVLFMIDLHLNNRDGKRVMKSYCRAEKEHNREHCQDKQTIVP